MNKHFRFIAFNVSVVLAFFLLLEVILRIFFTQIQPQGFSNDLISENQFESSAGLTPEAEGKAFGRLIKVDRLGCREDGVEFDSKKKSWLHLGDSVTLGVGVEDDQTFSALLAQEFDDINVLNPSVIGWGVSDYLNVVYNRLITDSNSWNIDHITIFLCLNDLYSGTPPSDAEGMNLRKRFGRLMTFLRSSYRTYIFLKGMLFDRGKAHFEYDLQFYAEEHEQYRSFLQNLEEIYRLCLEQHVDLDISILPYEYQFRTENFLPQEMVQSWCENSEVDLVRLEEAFQTIDEIQGNYLYADGIHFNEEGHRLLASFLHQVHE